jgi:hypothetical protein
VEGPFLLQTAMSPKNGLSGSTHDPRCQILIPDKEHRVFPLAEGPNFQRSVGHRALPETMPRGRRRGRSVLNMSGEITKTTVGWLPMKKLSFEF